MRQLYYVALISSILASPTMAQTARKPGTKSTTTKPAAAKPAPKAAAPAVLYDFKGVRLETTLEDFRKLPHPDGNDSRVACTGEKDGDKRYPSEPIDVRIYNEVEKSLGVIRCVWITQNQQYLNGSTSGLSVAGSGYATNTYAFSFIKDPKDGIAKLYQYSGQTNVAAFDDTLQALTTKWGTPTVAKGTVQNKVGNSFDNTTAIWTNPLSTILIESRFTKIDDMGIIVTDTRLAKIVSDAKAAKKAATPNGI